MVKGFGFYRWRGVGLIGGFKCGFNYNGDDAKGGVNGGQEKGEMRKGFWEVEKNFHCDLETMDGMNKARGREALQHYSEERREAPRFRRDKVRNATPMWRDGRKQSANLVPDANKSIQLSY
ncbi:hypothetical protein HAX54_031894 [Datura stramonium]|uniref:Uncharacterized protein n=1 Tax=Datura stramonium TaxID=4076 RepID=A0ABS8VAP7_DATST|nr:hypothetical protein [Datura stramonium]